MARSPTAPKDLAAEVASIDWYHTMELAPGIVTPGWLDTRAIRPSVPFPLSLSGKRCLDVGTFNGFWAFEMERLGADEVVAVDVVDPFKWDWPVGSDPAVIEEIGKRQAGGLGFEIAHRELGSSVERLERSVYDLSPEDMGKFDLVYLGSLLVHLRDPVAALERIRSVCSGTLIVVDGIDLPLSLLFPRTPAARLDARGRPWWWFSNAAGLGRLIEAAGFEVLDGPRRVWIPRGPGHPSGRLGRWVFSLAGLKGLMVASKGHPHAVAAARPRPTP